VFFTSGLVRLSIPGTDQVTYIEGGKYGFAYNEDTDDVSSTGHLTEYVSDAVTGILAVPLAPGVQVPHTVLRDAGPCTYEHMTGL
jgi:hypothetical protein